MTDNQQQIEEIQLIMLNAIDKRYFSTKDVKLNNDTEFLKQAEALYNKNYRKIPEGSIVVDKEYLKTELRELEFQACMAMAKKCREFVRQWTGDDDGLLFDLEDFIDEQLGVKIEWRYNDDQ